MAEFGQNTSRWLVYYYPSGKVGYFLSVRILLIQAQRNTGGNVDDVNRNANPRQGQGLDLADDMADINNLLQDIQDVEAEWNME